MDTDQNNNYGKLIEFRKKEDKNKTILKKQQIKDIVNLLIDNYEGDFCLLFNVGDMKDLFNSRISSEVLICTTNVEEANELMSTSKKRTYYKLID